MFERLRRSIARHIAIGEDEFRHFASMLDIRHVRKKESLLTPGDVCLFEGFVNAGCMRVYCTNPQGTDQILYFAQEDSWVADIHSFVSQSPSRLGIDALEHTEVFLIDREKKERLYAEMPQFERLFRIISQRGLASLQYRTMGLMLQSAEERYLDFKRRYPLLDRRLAQYHIASYIGICPEFLSKIRKKVSSRFS